MSFTWSRMALLGACALCLLMVGRVTSARDGAAARSSSEPTEVLMGQYHCGVGVDRPEVFAYYIFEASGDLFPRSPSLYRTHQVDAASPELCDGLAEAASAGLTAGGCSVGAVERFDDETGSTRSFQLVCHDLRSGLVALVADLAAEHLTGAL